jgi:(2R)-sulfolactate sulfo-lyase subunit beta
LTQAPLRQLPAGIDREGANLLGAQPTQGNIVGGLSTIWEKAMGNIAKTGSRPVVDAKRAAEAPVKRGRCLPDTRYDQALDQEP